MSIKQHVPNFVTLLNLLSGCIAVIFAVNDHFIATALFVCIGICFDFFDGFLARKLNVQSALGLQLDSLADMVTSGLVPGIIMYKLIASATNANGVFVVEEGWNKIINLGGGQISLIASIGLLITLASAYRLAKFNIDEDQQMYFKGLPTPANTLLILSMPLILYYQYSVTVAALFTNTWFLIGVTLVSCYLLNSNIKLFALKFKDWSFKSNAMRYLFLILSVVLLITLKFIAIPAIIILYVLISLFNQKQIN
ncbi:CDP-alcohol phosphatidyltransferase family protein [Winogradskyella immobilis]|uniref:CDP-alcohol phosphatidyltransferase family protein n=1 Tax=Winogradskyella immobilis TaxID=2816852 RepID=A0ABS8ENV8_9FLAO|nr:CDP-alcohol phosphatidyltransferase family protein [Winogradskyella immobilis]MCC1484878.1 CDP-alcohol phosphatidyltransferase family protein [Winogradskyella immobilis]MCG0016970.1 CDP-alcohol phosphatidyltransferase family protein [Winogradskyella immobilis]